MHRTPRDRPSSDVLSPRGQCVSLGLVLLLALAGSPPTQAAEDPGHAPARAAAGWTTPVRVTGATDVSSAPLVAAAPEGDVTVVWSTNGAVRSRTRQAGGTWGPILRVATGNVQDVGVDADGDVTVVWVRWLRGQRGVLMTATRPDGGAWSTPRRLSRIPRSRGTYTLAWDARVDVSPDGAAVAAWTFGSEHGGPEHRAQAAYRPAGGSWGPPVRIARPPSFARDAEIASSGIATTLVAKDGLRTVRRSTTGWHPVGGTITRKYSEATLQVGPRGHAVAVWDRWHGGGTGPRSTAHASRLVDGRWRQPLRLSGRRVPGSGVDVGVDARGVATLTWTARQGRLRVSRWTPGTTPTPPRTLSREAGDVRPLVAPNGATTVVWTKSPKRPTRFFAASRAPGGTWSAPQQISMTRQFVYGLDADIWPGGRAVVTWQTERRDGETRGWVSWKR